MGFQKDRTKTTASRYPVGQNFGRPREWTDDKIEAECAALEEWVKDPDNYYIASYAISRGYTSDTLDKLAERNSNFRRTLTSAKEACEHKIVDGSLSRKYDGSFAKFLLANKAGWKEKTELSGDKNSPLAFILGDIDGTSKDAVSDS